MSDANIHYWSYIRKPRRDYRLDPTRLFADADVCRNAIKDLAEPFRDSGINKVVALDALGFSLGGGIAYVLGAGLVHLRKEGKISWDVEVQAFRDYSQTDKIFEIARDAVQAGDKVLIVDDWSETGAQLKAACQLVERLQGRVIGAALLHIDEPVWRDPALTEYKLHHLFDYD